MSTRTISDTAEELVPQNSLRRSITIQNQDSAILVYIKKEQPGATTVSPTDHDIRLSPGGALSLNNFLDGAESIQERYTIVASSGTPRISILETENIDRQLPYHQQNDGGNS